MAEKKTSPKEARQRKAAEKKPAAAAATPASSTNSTKKGINPTVAIIAVIAVVVIAIAVILLSPQLLGAVPFSTFKSNFQGASNVSVTATFSNTTQYAAESPCFSSMIQAIAHTRKANTINFFIINSQNGTCTYSKNGLGGDVVPVTANASYCLNTATTQPGIFLNYSTTNSTYTTSYHAYVEGNRNYMAVCPIAIELS